MEQYSKYSSNYHQIPALDYIQVSIVAGPERPNNTIQNVASQQCPNNLLKLEYIITSRVKRQVSLNYQLTHTL